MRISDSERKIMNLLWKQSPLTITQMTHIMEKDEGWSKSMVITYLNRLEKKGAVWYEQGKRARYYFPAIEQDDTNVKEAKNFLNKAFDGKIGLMVSTLIREEALSQEDIEELEQILKENNNK